MSESFAAARAEQQQQQQRQQVATRHANWQWSVLTREELQEAVSDRLGAVSDKREEEPQRRAANFRQHLAWLVFFLSLSFELLVDYATSIISHSPLASVARPVCCRQIFFFRPRRKCRPVAHLRPNRQTHTQAATDRDALQKKETNEKWRFFPISRAASVR